MRQTCRILAVMGALAMAGRTPAVQIQDLARIKGAESSKLVGMGLVVGLAGTGDGGKFLPAMRPLAAVISRLMGDPNVVTAELKDAKNVALVSLEASTPANGVREGDRVDVHVSAVGSAKSLAGGRLFLIPMTGPLPDSPVFAFASGPVTIEDPAAPTVGVVKGGAQLTADITAGFLNEYGQTTLVLNNEVAGWQVAQTVAELINHEMAPDEPPIAQASDPKNVVVTVPMQDRAAPGVFMSRLLRTYVDVAILNTGARVLINEKTQTIIVGADVQVAPTIISHPGLTITTITPAAQPTVANPQVQTSAFVAIDPGDRGGTKLQDLLEALEQLKVPPADRVKIVRELKRSGKLYAELIVE